MHSLRRLLVTFPLIGSFQMAYAQDLYVDGNIIGLGYHADTDVPGYITSYADGDDVLETVSTVDFGIAGGWGRWTWWQGTDSFVVAAPVKQMQLDESGLFSLYNCDSTNNFPGVTVFSSSTGARITGYHGFNQVTGSLLFDRIPGSSTSGLVSITAGSGGGMSIRSNNGDPAKVGIGVNDPTEKLDVAGNIKLSGNLITSGGGILTLPSGNGAVMTTNASQTVTGNATFTGTTTTGALNTANVGIGATAPTASKLAVETAAIGSDRTIATFTNTNSTAASSVSLALKAGNHTGNVTSFADSYGTASLANSTGILVEGGATTSYLGAWNDGTVRFHTGAFGTERVRMTPPATSASAPSRPSLGFRRAPRPRPPLLSRLGR